MECPTPEKVAYDSAGAARFFAQADGLRYHICAPGCGKYHLSSKRVGRSKK